MDVGGLGEEVKGNNVTFQLTSTPGSVGDIKSKSLNLKELG